MWLETYCVSVKKNNNNSEHGMNDRNKSGIVFRYMDTFPVKEI